MSKPQQTTTSFAALVFDIGADGITNEAHLLPAGSFRAEDGRPSECANWQLTPEIAARVIARMAAKTNDTLIDYEHQSLHKEANGKPAPAAGWFHQLEFRTDGLWAINVGWTASAKKAIAEKEYRYISAVFSYYKGTGEVLEIISVAVTNTPALDGLNSLAALSKYHLTTDQINQTQSGDEPMDQTKEVAVLTVERDTLKTSIATLTTERDTLKTDVVALSLERDALKVKVEAIEKAQAEAALAVEKSKHTDLITAALTDGRIAPAQKAWAEKQSLAALTEYLDASKPILAAGRQHEAAGTGEHGLNAEELAMCTKMGVTPEDYAKNK